jgi:hypothetical protein
MIWALLAILGVPIWLILGALGGTLLSRRRFRSQAAVFPIVIRAARRDSWPRATSYGRLVRDVLVVNRGLALVRTELFPIADVRQLDAPLPEKKIAGATGRVLSVDEHDDLEVGIPMAVGNQLDLLSMTPDPIAPDPITPDG